jgi:hypothetical protein
MVSSLIPSSFLFDWESSKSLSISLMSTILNNKPPRFNAKSASYQSERLAPRFLLRLGPFLLCGFKRIQ